MKHKLVILNKNLRSCDTLDDQGPNKKTIFTSKYPNTSYSLCTVLTGELNGVYISLALCFG